MDQYGARLTRYTVTRIGASMYPCFCGDDNGEGLEVIQDDGRWAVECQACFIQGDWMETPEEAIAAWNASQAADLKKMFAK